MNSDYLSTSPQIQKSDSVHWLVSFFNHIPLLSWIKYRVCWQEDLVKSPNWVLPMPNHFFGCPYEKPSTTFAHDHWKKFNLVSQSTLIFTKISDFCLFYYRNELSKLSSSFSWPEFQAKTIYTRCTMKKYIMIWWSNGGTPARVKCYNGLKTIF